MRGNKLAKWRKSKGFSVSYCAQEAGVARGTWRRGEARLPLSLDVADRIVSFVSAHGGAVSYRDLVSISEQKRLR